METTEQPPVQDAASYWHEQRLKHFGPAVRPNTRKMLTEAKYIDRLVAAQQREREAVDQVSAALAARDDAWRCALAFGRTDHRISSAQTDAIDGARDADRRVDRALTELAAAREARSIAQHNRTE
jgi:hypothetical protein